MRWIGRGLAALGVAVLALVVVATGLLAAVTIRAFPPPPARSR